MARKYDFNNKDDLISAEDDLVTARGEKNYYPITSQRSRTQTGRSFFPAADTYGGGPSSGFQLYRTGTNIPAGTTGTNQFGEALFPVPRRQWQQQGHWQQQGTAINSTPQGQAIQFTGAGSGGFRALPPDQNPAYQAAIAKGRPNRADYTTIQLPSRGTSSVPTASVGRYLAASPGSAIFDPNRAQDITHLQNQLNFPQIYNQGYANNYTPASAPLTPQERVQRGQAGFGQIASVAAHNIFGVPQNQNIFAGLARNWFGGAGGQQAAQYGSNVSTGQPPSNPATTQQPSVQSQNFYAYNPSPVPVRTRYSDPNVPSYFP